MCLGKRPISAIGIRCLESEMMPENLGCWLDDGFCECLNCEAKRWWQAFFRELVDRHMSVVIEVADAVNR